MPGYRLFFLDHRGVIAARQEFEAADDDTALDIAAVAADACSDAHNGYMLWRRDQQLAEVRSPAPRAAHELSLERQQCVLDLEEMIHRSHWHIAKSRKLLEAMADWRAFLGDDAKGGSLS